MLHEANLQNILTIKSILRCFEMGSGFKVNFHKSKIRVLGVDRNVIQRYFKVLNCNIIEVPFKYLGLPVEVNPINQSF